MPLIFQRLLSFVLYACSSPQLQHQHHQHSRGSSVTSPASSEKVSFMNAKNNEYSVINFVPFGEKALSLMTSLYEEYANHSAILENQILKQIIRVNLKKFFNDFCLFMVNYYFFIDSLYAAFYEIHLSKSNYMEIGDRMSVEDFEKSLANYF